MVLTGRNQGTPQEKGQKAGKGPLLGKGWPFPPGSCSHDPLHPQPQGPGGPPPQGDSAASQGALQGLGHTEAGVHRGVLGCTGECWSVLGCTGVHWGAGLLLALGAGLVQDARCGRAACRLRAPSIRLGTAHRAWGLSSIVNSIRVSFSGLLG